MDPFAGLPAHVLADILLYASAHENLVWHVAVCAQVHPNWRRVVLNTLGYGLNVRGVEVRQPVRRRRYGRPSDADHRGNVLANIADGLGNLRLSADGRLKLSALRYHAPRRRRRYEWSTFRSLALCPEGAKVLAACMRALPTELQPSDICLSYNHGLGDAGIEALAAALPAHLRCLSVHCTGLGDAGMEKLVNALPPTLVDLDCGNNSKGITHVGWAMLGRKLPHLPRLEVLGATQCAMDNRGLAALVVGLARAPKLMQMSVQTNHIGDEGMLALSEVLQLQPRPALRFLMFNAWDEDDADTPCYTEVGLARIRMAGWVQRIPGALWVRNDVKESEDAPHSWPPMFLD